MLTLVTLVTRVMLVTLVTWVVTPAAARADGSTPSMHEPRGRPCCALAADMAIHLGSAHVPVVLGGVLSPRALGHHSYLRDGGRTEPNGFVYTRRGGFIDLGHTRDNADIAAYLALRLRPLLRRGEGMIDFGPKGAERHIRVIRALPEDEIDGTSERLAIRIAFQMSIWTELVQYYGLTKFAGAEEIYSSFTPDDLYSNLLGAHLGILALDSSLPYDEAMDVALRTTLDSLGVVTARETRRTLARLAGTWWSPEYAWPAREIAVLRTFDLGPDLAPSLAPEEVIAARGAPLVVDVPVADEKGEPLTADYQLDILPHPGEMARFPPEEKGKAFTGDDLPRLVEKVRRAFDADAAAAARGEPTPSEGAVHGAVGHYLTGIRLFELGAEGGAQGPAEAPGPAPGRVTGHDVSGVGGGHLVVVRGDTRGGDFGILRLDVLHQASRGTMASVGFFRGDALWFCHDPESHALRWPLLSLLGPCAPGEIFGIGGSLGEALHDGGTGRTALRPVSLAGVWNPLGNGQSPSYDGARLLLHLGGEVEHIWSEGAGARTLPRATSSLSFLLRTPSRRVELHGAAGYRLDPGKPRDGVFESDLALMYNFILGGTKVTGARERLDPWGLAAIGVEGSYSYWSRPENAYPELAAPFVSTDRPGTWQLLLTGTLGFESLAF